MAHLKRDLKWNRLLLIPYRDIPDIPYIPYIGNPYRDRERFPISGIRCEDSLHRESYIPYIGNPKFPI